LGLPENLDASYGTRATGVYPNRIPIAMSNMGYKNATFTSSFSREILDSELKNSNPVLIGGYTSDDGHRFIIDGGYYTIKPESVTLGSEETVYKYYYHCIWGWGGRANGYFLLDTDTPSIGGTPTIADDGTTGSSPVWKNLNMVYGYSPDK
jgi:hypothetical protein